MPLSQHSTKSIQSSPAAAETNSMKCIHVACHGNEIDELVSMSTTALPTRSKHELLVKVQACSLAPGDVRVLKGHCDYFQEPPGGMPYIPGGDLAGKVVDLDKNSSRFQVGDSVISMFDLPRPYGALAEYAIVKESNTELAPKTIDPVKASCLTSSGVAALYAANTYIKPGDRVLVLGGSGGVGSLFVQLAKQFGACFVAATSTDRALLEPLGVDRVIDYRQENWWEIADFQEHPFDVVLDAVGGYESWKHAMNSEAVKNGWNSGRFIAMIGDEPHMQIHNVWQTLVFMKSMLGRCLWTGCWWWVPKYLWGSLNLQAAPLIDLVNLVDEGKLKVVLDLASPLVFTAEDVKRGLLLMEKRKAHGKVVVEMSPD